MEPRHRHRDRTAASRYLLLGLVAAIAAAAALVTLRYHSSHRGTNLQTNAADATRTGASAAGTNVVATAGSLSPSELDQLVRTMNDASLTLAERKKAILALARDGSPAAIAALKDALAHSPTDIRKAIAEALGECHTPAGLALLIELMKDPDMVVAKAAIRALARQDQAGAATALSQLLNDTTAAAGLRCEAALALGDLKQPWVLDPLSRIARHDADQDVAEAALDAIGKLNFNDTKSFFEDYIHSSDTPSDLRLAAIDAVAASQGDPTSFLSQLAGNKDMDSDTRAEAAWALSNTEATGNATADLLAMLKNESDPEVRLRLYQALNNQDDYDTAAVLALVQQESQPAAVSAGLESLAKAYASNPTDAQLQNYFDQTGIDQLKQIIAAGGDVDTRQKAVIALTALAAAHDQNAIDALNAIRQQMAAQQQQSQSPTPRTTPPPPPRRRQPNSP